MFTIFIIRKCLKENIKPNIVAILFLMIIDFTLVFSLIGMSKVQARSYSPYYTEGRANTNHNGNYVYYDDTYCPVRFNGGYSLCYCDNGYFKPSQEKVFVDNFYSVHPEYFSDDYTMIFCRSTDYSNNYRVVVWPKNELVSLTCTFEGLSDSANGVTISGVQWKHVSLNGAICYKTNTADGSFSSEQWGTSGTWYCNGYDRSRYTGICWNAYIPITNDMSGFAEGHNWSYYWDDREYFINYPYIQNTNTELQYMSGSSLTINYNTSGATNLTFQLFECDENGNAIPDAPFFFEMSNLDENSPYYHISGDVILFDIPFYDFVNVELVSGKTYNWSLIGNINGVDFVKDKIIKNNVTWNNSAGVNNAIIDSQNNTSNTIQNQTDWQQQSASGDFDFSSISSPSFEDPTSGVTNLFSGIVDTLSNWESESLILKIPTSVDGYYSPPYILEIPGNYVEERLKWMFTTYDDMSVNPTHSGFVIINIIKTVWCFVFGRWVFIIVRKLVDKIKSGKILDNNIEDITGDML